MATTRGTYDTPSCSAAEMPIGIMTRAVAVLLISCPSTAVMTNIPASNAYGPASPTRVTSASASMPAAPLLCMAADSDNMPPTRITVVHEIPW